MLPLVGNGAAELEELQKGNVTKMIQNVNETSAGRIADVTRTLNDDVTGRVILSLCDATGNWSRPYREAGYRVVQVDLSAGLDVRQMLYPGRVWGILAAPPCTMFAIAGARWKRSEEQMLEALSVVDACLRLVAVCRPVWWALENPVGKLTRYLGKPACYFNPCDYGGWNPEEPSADGYTKKTGLWGSFRRLEARPVPVTLPNHILYMSPGVNRQARRSVTPLGFSYAFYNANR